MKAVVHDRYGPPEVLRLEDVQPPVPQADEILVRIRATTVNRTECHRRAADPVMCRLLAGLGRPRRRILGSELAGEVAAAGQAITEFAPGDQVIDYTREDFTANGQTYDVIYDAVGKHSFRRCAGSLKPGGKYLATDGLQDVVLAVWTARLAGKKVVFPVPPRYTKEDVLFLSGLIEAVEYHAVVDRCYPLEQVVEATRYVETRQKRGNVVLTVSDGRR